MEKFQCLLFVLKRSFICYYLRDFTFKQYFINVLEKLQNFVSAKTFAS